MSSFSGVTSSSPHSLVHLLPPFSPALTTCISSSSCILGTPKSSLSFINPRTSISFHSKSRKPNFSIWVASKRVPQQTHESNWEYPDDGSGSEYDDYEENGKVQEWEFESDYEEEEKEAGVAAVRNSNTAATQYKEELMKEVKLLLEPEEKAILEHNEYPVLSKISTVKSYK